MQTRLLWLCAIGLPLAAQESSFKDVHLDKSPVRRLGAHL